jgi:hypothetical protein
MAKKPQPKSEARAVRVQDLTSDEVAAIRAAQPRDAKLVKMVRPESYPAPHTADVHPDMVEDYAAGGWERA